MTCDIFRDGERQTAQPLPALLAMEVIAAWIQDDDTYQEKYDDGTEWRVLTAIEFRAEHQKTTALLTRPVRHLT